MPNTQNPTAPLAGTPLADETRFMSEYNTIGLVLIPVIILISILIRILWVNEGLFSSFGKGTLWGLVFYTAIIVPLCWKFVKSNKALIIQNILVSETAPRTDEETTDVIQPIPGQRGIGAGPHFVIPLIEQVHGDPIDMKVLKNLPFTVDVVDKNEQPYTVEGLIPISPTPGRWLPNFRRVDDKTAEETLLAIFKPWVEQKFKTLVGIEVLKDIEGFRSDFKNVLLGPNMLAPVEKSIARFTGIPYISSIKKKETTEVADEASIRADRVKAVATKLKDAGIDQAGKYAYALVTSDKSVQLEDQGIRVDVTGLENLTNLNLPPEAVDLLRGLLGKKGKKP